MSCSCCCVPGSSWLCSSAGGDDTKCLVKNKFSSRTRTTLEPHPGPPDHLQPPRSEGDPQEEENLQNQQENNMDIEVLREQYRWTRDQQRTETRVLLFRQVSQELCEAANIIPVSQGLPLPWEPPAASPTPCGTPTLTSDPWHTHLGLHRRACLHAGGGVSLKPAPPATGTSFTSSSTCSWPASSLSDTTSSCQQGARVRRSSVDSTTSRRTVIISSSDVSAGSSMHSGTASKAEEPSDGSPQGSLEGPGEPAAELHHSTHLSRESPEGSLTGSPRRRQQPSTFPRYASREEEELEEMDSSVNASRDGSTAGSPGGSKDASGEGSASSSDEGSTPTPRSVCNSASEGTESHGEQGDDSLDRNVLTVGTLDTDNNNTVAMAAVVEPVPDNHHSQWNGGSGSSSASRGSRKLSAPSLIRQSSLGGCQPPRTPSLARQSSLGGCQPPRTPSAPSLHQHYYPFPNRKTPRKSEAARKLGMYSSF